MIEIEVVANALPADLPSLAPAAAAEGIRTIDVVREEWANGQQRFSAAGERLLAARVEGQLAAIGGITRDDNFGDALRIRRFYVLPRYRGLGIARAMAERLLDGARNHVDRVTLRAGSPEAARFWERLGFTPVTMETHTHELRF